MGIPFLDTMAKRKNVDRPPTQAIRSSGVRNYVWTLNNYTDENLFEIDSLIENESNLIRYICYGKEVGENTKTPHLQGYLELTDKGINLTV